MSKGQDLVQFAVRFTRMDLNQLRSGDLLNLQEDFGHFLVPTDHFADTSAYPEQETGELSKDDMKGLQDEFTHILLGVVALAGTALGNPGPPIARIFFLPQRCVQTGLAVFPAHPDHFAPIFVGPTRDAIVMQLLMALTQIPLDALQICSECSSVFYRVRHQRFCSPTCRNRANTRHFREVHNQEPLDHQADPGRDHRHRTATTV